MKGFLTRFEQNDNTQLLWVWYEFLYAQTYSHMQGFLTRFEQNDNSQLSWIVFTSFVIGDVEQLKCNGAKCHLNISAAIWHILAYIICGTVLHDNIVLAKKYIAKFLCRLPKVANKYKRLLCCFAKKRTWWSQFLIKTLYVSAFHRRRIVCFVSCKSQLNKKSVWGRLPPHQGNFNSKTYPWRDKKSVSQCKSTF